MVDFIDLCVNEYLKNKVTPNKIAHWLETNIEKLQVLRLIRSLMFGVKTCGIIFEDSMSNT